MFFYVRNIGLGREGKKSKILTRGLIWVLTVYFDGNPCHPTVVKGTYGRVIEALPPLQAYIMAVKKKFKESSSFLNGTAFFAASALHVIFLYSFHNPPPHTVRKSYYRSAL